MKSSFIDHLELFFKKLIPLSVQPTDAVPVYTKDETIKAVIFDVYGTLIISESTDTIQASYNASMLTESLTHSGFQIKVPETDLMNILSLFEKEVITGKEQAKASGIPFPELNIVDVWQRTLKQAEKKDLIAFTRKTDIKRFVFIFELNSNQVWPMPGLKETLAVLKSRGYPLGIVSNAQFYTPVILNYFLYGELKEDEFVDGFEEDLCVFSYKILKAKPDTVIFESLIEPLDRRGLTPENVLYVGNDMLKDIYAAAQVGFKTCLYAGDSRVYHLRKDYPEVSKIKPNHIITELKQLREVL
jgi:putative hydrolase of the HAD superfamily